MSESLCHIQFDLDTYKYEKSRLLVEMFTVYLFSIDLCVLVLGLLLVNAFKLLLLHSQMCHKF